MLRGVHLLRMLAQGAVEGGFTTLRRSVRSAWHHQQTSEVVAPPAAMVVARVGGSLRPVFLCTSALVATVCLTVYIMQNSGVCSLHTAALFRAQRPLGGVATPAGLLADGAAQQRSSPRTCPSTQEVQASAWAQSCYLVTKVCVDRGKQRWRRQQYTWFSVLQQCPIVCCAWVHLMPGLRAFLWRPGM